MKNQKSSRAPKILAACVLLLFLGVAGAAFLWHTLVNLDYFRIREIAASEPNIIDLSFLKGRNIFSVDLDSQAQRLTESYPIYKKIRLIRVLPDRLFVDFIKRKPVAYIKLYKYFSVDEDGVLFEIPGGIQPQELPILLGLETKILGPKAGKKFNVKELQLALQMIRQVRSDRMLKYWRMTRVSMSNPQEASIFMALPVKRPGIFLNAASASPEPDPIEVKLGDEDTAGKIRILTSLLIHLKNDWVNIKYIDLRFNEPAVKFKEKDAKK